MGRTGSGISATGNSVLGKQQFDSSPSGESLTKDLERGEVTRFEQKLTVIDTPGFSNRKLKDEDVLNKIKAYSGGYSAILLVLDINSFNENEGFISNLRLMLPSNFENYLIVIFTHTERFKHVDSNKTISDVIATFKNNSEINQLLHRAGDRYVDFQHYKTFANNNQLDKQVKDILTMVSKLPKDFFYFDPTAKQVVSETTTTSTFIHFKIEKIEICIVSYQIILLFMLPCFLLCFFIRKLMLIDKAIQNVGQRLLAIEYEIERASKQISH